MNGRIDRNHEPTGVRSNGARGETDAAFEWLERAYAQRDTGLAGMKWSPHLRSLHGDPRWSAFLKKMGFEV